jgi:putative PIN family toxin of toxin-antitoxin system
MEILGKTRVVLDSNIYISALLFGGKPLRAVQLAEQGAFILLTSAPIQSEVENILATKFRYSRAMIHKSCHRVWRFAERLEPIIHVDICRDDDDNKILECAIAGDASYIVTGDRDLLDLPSVSQYTILKVDAFLKVMESEG